MREKLDWLLPKFVRFPLLMVVVFNIFVYYAPTRIIPINGEPLDLSLALDAALPCIPFFLLFYVLAYVQWIGSHVFHSRDSVQLCYRLAMADIIAKMICLVFFVLTPTQITRPEVTGSGFFEWGTRFIHSIDTPVNLFPSIHCLESWLCFRGAMMLQKKNGWYITAQGVLSLLVFASTALIKQHFVIDIPAGILACEIGLFLSGRCGLWRVFNKVQTPSAKAWLKEHQL